MITLSIDPVDLDYAAKQVQTVLASAGVRTTAVYQCTESSIYLYIRTTDLHNTNTVADHIQQFLSVNGINADLVRVLQEGDLAVLPLQDGFSCLSTFPPQPANSSITLEDFLKDLDRCRIASDILLERLAVPVQVISDDDNVDQPDQNVESLDRAVKVPSSLISHESDIVSQPVSFFETLQPLVQTSQDTNGDQADQSDDNPLEPVKDSSFDQPSAKANLDPASAVDGQDQGKLRPSKPRPRASPKPSRSFPKNGPRPIPVKQFDQAYTQLAIPFQDAEMGAIANIGIRGDPGEDTPVYTRFRMPREQDEAV